jgi:phosphate transport system protein
MPRQVFDMELERLQDEVLVLGSMVEKALVESVEMLGKRDLEGGRRLVEADGELNKRRYAIEADVLKIIATQQPMASDMRLLAAILEIAGELERMGDYAKGIAKIILLHGEEPLLKPLVDLPRMAEIASSMLQRALTAFIERDVEAARAIPREDDAMDALYNQVYRELLTYIIADPRTISRANYLIWAAHNLERTADRVTNICERVVYAVTGELTELDVDTVLEYTPH